MSSPPNTVRLHRVLRAMPERVYRAFLDPDAMCKWSPPHGFTGKSPSFGGTYLELTPHQTITYNDRFDDPILPGEMLVTITLRQVACGTDLKIVQTGIPESIPMEFCYLGWQESLVVLAQLVEPEIPDGA